MVALAAAVPVLLWHAAAPGRDGTGASAAHGAFIVFGGVGVGLHYDGNLEFERELHPKDTGMTFLARAGRSDAAARARLDGATRTARPRSYLPTPVRQPAAQTARRQCYEELIRTLYRARIRRVVAAAQAQTGKPVTIVDANAVTAAELAKLPHMTADRRRPLSPSARSRRPRTSMAH